MDYPKDNSSAQDPKTDVIGAGDGSKLDQPEEKGQSLVFPKDAKDTSVSEEKPAEPSSFKYPKAESQAAPPAESTVLDVSGKVESGVSQDPQKTEEPEAKDREFPVLEVSEDLGNKSLEEIPESVVPKPVSQDPVNQNLASQEPASKEPSLTDVLKEPVKDAVQDSPKSDFESSYEPKKDDSQESPDTIKANLADLSFSSEGKQESVSGEERLVEKDGSEKLGSKPMAGIEATQLPETEDKSSEVEPESSSLEFESEKEDAKPGPNSQALPELEEEKEDVKVEPSSQVSPVEPPKESSFSAGKESSGIFKKILAIVLILLALSLIGFSIFKFVLPRIKGQSKVELVYWGLWESEGIMNQIISDFNREYPDIKVKYTMQSKQEYRERLQSALARDEGPDVFRFHATWTPMLKNQLDKVPENVLSASQYQSTFYPVAAKQLRSGSGYLGIPLEVDTLALFYNKEIFQMAGKIPPKTWEELRSTAIELTVRDASGRIQTAGVALGNTTNIEHWPDILGLMMVQNGVDLNMASKCSTFEGEEVCLGVDALRFYTLFNKVDQVWDNSMPGSTESFASGKLAMYFGYSWDVFEIQARNKNLNFGIVEAPQLSGDKISWASFWVEGVNTKSEFKEEAWQFMKFLSKKETLEKLYSLSSNTRSFGEPYPRVDMRAMLSSNPLVSPFVNQASYAQTWYLCSRTYDNGINDKMIDYFKDAVNAVNSNKDPKQALQTASMGVSQLLSQYGLGSYTVR